MMNSSNTLLLYHKVDLCHSYVLQNISFEAFLQYYKLPSLFQLSFEALLIERYKSIFLTLSKVKGNQVHPPPPADKVGRQIDRQTDNMIDRQHCLSGQSGWMYEMAWCMRMLDVCEGLVYDKWEGLALHRRDRHKT